VIQEIKNKLSEFDAISLDEMDSVKLMNRTDTKFVFNQEILPIILEQLKNDYRVLEINGNRISKYESLYFDTPNFNLYHAHQRGKLNRYKVRFRKYVDSELNFFEVKLKNNKGRTIKDRVKQLAIPNIIQDKAADLLIEKTNLNALDLEPKIWVNYSRITFVNKNAPERLTIDLNLHFNNNEKIKFVDNLVIAEVKQSKSKVSPFIKLMKEKHIIQGSISKYCYGIITLFEKIKHNNFKPKLVPIKKITHAVTTNH